MDLYNTYMHVRVHEIGPHRTDIHMRVHDIGPHSTDRYVRVHEIEPHSTYVHVMGTCNWTSQFKYACEGT